MWLNRTGRLLVRVHAAADHQGDAGTQNHGSARNVQNGGAHAAGGGEEGAGLVLDINRGGIRCVCSSVGDTAIRGNHNSDIIIPAIIDF